MSKHPLLLRFRLILYQTRLGGVAPFKRLIQSKIQEVLDRHKCALASWTRFRMQPQEPQLRASIVEIGKCVWQKGWVAANDGNISCRLPGDRILCTPTGVSKGMMTADDMIICDLEGN